MSKTFAYRQKNIFFLPSMFKKILEFRFKFWLSSGEGPQDIAMYVEGKRRPKGTVGERLGTAIQI